MQYVRIASRVSEVYYLLRRFVGSLVEIFRVVALLVVEVEGRDVAGG